MPTPLTRVLQERYDTDPQFNALCVQRSEHLGRHRVSDSDLHEVALFYEMLEALHLRVAPASTPRSGEPSLVEYALAHQKTHPLCFKGLNDSYGFKLIEGGIRCLRCGTDVLRLTVPTTPAARCPTCGSTGPGARVPDDWGNLGFCGDPWHKGHEVQR